MDRRRFVPAPEGLEGRALLSLFGSTTKNTLNNPAADVPVTFRQKQLRVEHLPFYLGQMQQGRFLPPSRLEKLQADLTSVIGTLHKPPFPRLVAFNAHLRKILPKNNLTAADANTLSRDFANAVEGTGATANQVSNLTNDMNDLAKIDAKSRQPVYLATNDYSLVLQTILGIGRPIQTPQAPVIAKVDGLRTLPGFAVTHTAQPRFVGSYGVGNTVGDLAGDPTGGFNSNGVVMKIIDKQGHVLGQAPVDAANGDYVVKIANPLPDGVYTIRIVAVDPQGHFSQASPEYHVKVRLAPTKAAEILTGQATPQGAPGLK